MSDIRTKAAISSLVNVDLEANQVDALRSLCFNIGIDTGRERKGFRGSTVLKKINEGEVEGALEYFGHWRKDSGGIRNGLIKRRFAELFIFADKTLDPNDKTIPSEQWGLDPMPLTDENWGRLNVSLRNEAVTIYDDYVS